MANKTSAAMAQVLKLVFAGKMKPYGASKLYELDKSSVYSNPIYKQWKGGDIEGAQRALDDLLRPRRIRKPAGAH